MYKEDFIITRVMKEGGGGGVHGAEGNTPSALRRQVDIVCVSGAL